MKIRKMEVTMTNHMSILFPQSYPDCWKEPEQVPNWRDRAGCKEELHTNNQRGGEDFLLLGFYFLDGDVCLGLVRLPLYILQCAKNVFFVERYWYLCAKNVIFVKRYWWSGETDEGSDQQARSGRETCGESYYEWCLSIFCDLLSLPPLASLI